MGKKKLVIVESPAKAKTINRYLGNNFTVKASVGHVRDLPKSTFGVDLENNFEPKYVTLRDKKKVIDELKSAASRVDEVFLASDPDREGEAIAWHISEILQKENKGLAIKRVLFNEITKKAIVQALEHPGEIVQPKVDAQQARRIIDRIVGYKISPFLWEKISRNLSAGRVQSVALRLVCEREKEIDAFVTEEYWSVVTQFIKDEVPFQAKLFRIKEKKAQIKDGDTAHAIVDALKKGSFTVGTVEKKQKRKRPMPPFTTSKLQQDASRKLRFSAKKTMMVAQSLYEGVNLGEYGQTGLITYMRTDSTRLSQDAIDMAREYIGKTFGPDYLPEKPRVYATGGKTQDAHEAIRPTTSLNPESIKAHLTGDQYRLYKLVFDKFLASQMADALIDATAADIINGDYTLRATGSVVAFAGHLALYQAVEESAKKEEDILPPLHQGDKLTSEDIQALQHFTQPPPRYTEATLVKTLEEKGIGRPSTYASILSTIEDRKYVEKEDRKFTPTERGKIVNELLVNHFPELFEYSFTANLEAKLDRIEEGEENWKDTLGNFYEGFQRELEKAKESLKHVDKINIKSGVACPKCEAELVIKSGRNGEFLACIRYPECEFTSNFTKEEDGSITIVQRPAEEMTSIACDKCGKPMAIKMSRRGPFLACSGYPECKNPKSFRREEDGTIVVVEKKPAEPTDIACEKCGAPMVIRASRRGEFLACSAFPKCRNTKNMERDEQGKAVIKEKKATAKEPGEKAAAPKAKAAAKKAPAKKSAAKKK
ncbi:DNA topoisomerase I [Desulfurispirillum indicum S5]|uniref:DNA topoisomerase 1 n=1 Tax=Desulfurispirillum indicum (strain ATCC BAA-1389 / DSM 22839 / S5) TaxID=653733 RepID=E6W3Q7_DESIS|nr:type I DNA topoisomerase [Desulfurispirillum indicum]ADU66938.1 DNA topoisomerase I [Desulfurispirillum indicum S5]